MKTDPRRWSRGALGALLASFAMLTHGQETPGIPALINYQGRLTDTLGNPVTSGYYEIQFRIWNDLLQAGEGNLVWARSFPLHVVTNGLFNVLLSDNGGAVTSPVPPANTNLLEAFDGPDRYLGLTITISNSVSVANGVEISPRQQLASAPFAVHAQTASATLPNAVDAASIKANSVATATLVDNAVTTAKLADGAVTSAKLANNVALTDRTPQSFTGFNRFINGMALTVPNTDKGLRSILQLWATFAGNATDHGPRRTADVIAGFANGTWGSEYLSLNVGSNGSSNDNAAQTSEKVRIQANGHVGIGTTTPASTLHVNGSVTLEQGPVSMFGALQPMTTSTRYAAATDGFVFITAYKKHLYYQIWAVGGSTPTIQQNEYAATDGSDTLTLTIPIARGENWQVDDTLPGSGYLRVYWRPIGK